MHVSLLTVVLATSVLFACYEVQSTHAAPALQIFEDMPTLDAVKVRAKRQLWQLNRLRAEGKAMQDKRDFRNCFFSPMQCYMNEEQAKKSHNFP